MGNQITENSIRLLKISGGDLADVRNVVCHLLDQIEQANQRIRQLEEYLSGVPESLRSGVISDGQV